MTNRTCRIVLLTLLCGLSSIAARAEWRRHTIDDSSEGADGIKSADINGDRRQDLVTGWEESGLVRVYLQPELARVAEPWPAVTVGIVDSPEDAVFVDLDRDDVEEVISCHEGDTRALFVHRCNNTIDILQSESWTTEPIELGLPLRQWMFATVLPSLVDSEVQIVAGAKGEGAELGLITYRDSDAGNGNWNWQQLHPAGWIMSIEAVDVDDDGDFDILFSDRRGPSRGVHWYEDASRNEWNPHSIGGADHEVMFLDTGDLDGDDVLEVVCAAKDAGILIFTRDLVVPDEWSCETVPLGDECGTAKGIALVDVDRDDDHDIVFSCENAKHKIGVGWLSAPDWELHDISGTDAGIKFDLLLPMDVNDDGWVDIITCEEADNLGVVWYENPGE